MQLKFRLIASCYSAINSIGSKFFCSHRKSQKSRVLVKSYDNSFTLKAHFGTKHPQYRMKRSHWHRFKERYFVIVFNRLRVFNRKWNSGRKHFCRLDGNCVSSMVINMFHKADHVWASLFTQNRTDADDSIAIVSPWNLKHPQIIDRRL